MAASQHFIVGTHELLQMRALKVARKHTAQRADYLRLTYALYGKSADVARQQQRERRGL